MELNSFKSILLRKADGNPNISQLLNSIDDDVFIDSVVEALEKMATNNTGKNASGPMTNFGQSLTSTDVHQMRDALGHHLSHYKAALSAHHAAPEGSPEKAQMRKVADQHLEHLIPMMHLAARAAKHSDNKLAITHPALPPWETNYTKLDRNKKGDGPLRDPKLLGARIKNSGSIDKTIKDYHYLEMPPHPGHEANAKMPHQSGYPWEEVQLGAPKDIDAKKAYLHIEDVPNKGEFTPHEFDSHPIRGVQDIRESHLSDDDKAAYADAVKNWSSGEPHKNWMNRLREAYKADPEGFKARGTKKSAHLYEGMPLQPHEAHVNDWPVVPKMQPKAAGAEEASSQPVAKPPSVRPSKQPVRTPDEIAANPTEADLEAAHGAWKKLPKNIQDVIVKANPHLAAYIAKKGGQ